MQARPLTLHIRLTKACNADCSYCSSWQESPERRLSPDSLTKILDFVLDTGPSALGINPTHLTAQFIGGEIAMVPSAELDQHIAVIKDACAKRSISYVFGAQSNLIVSDRRAAVLYDQFEGRLGTSIDLTSNTRTIKGDADIREIPSGRDRVLGLLETTLQSDMGRWILSKHEHDGQEVQVSGYRNGRWIHRYLDRPFVDGGFYWITDWKSAACPEGMDVEVFIGIIRSRYKKKMEEYESVVIEAGIELPIKKGMYLPAIDRFVEV